MTTLLTVAQVASRSGFAPSALRFYERVGLIAAQRTAGRQRRYERIVLRRLAFIRAARNVGLSLDEIREELAHLPDNRAPTSADWRRISRNWRGRLNDRITYSFESMEHGGRVRIRAAGPEARDAVHAFLRYQIREHATGDPVTVKK